jgi:hypothetical protein
MIVSERNPHATWIVADLLADDEAGELVATDDDAAGAAAAIAAAWADLHGAQAAATP